jgi:hypothetical protein
MGVLGLNMKLLKASIFFSIMQVVDQTDKSIRPAGPCSEDAPSDLDQVLLFARALVKVTK